MIPLKLPGFERFLYAKTVREIHLELLSERSRQGAMVTRLMHDQAESETIRVQSTLEGVFVGASICTGIMIELYRTIAKKEHVISCKIARIRELEAKLKTSQASARRLAAQVQSGNMQQAQKYAKMYLSDGSSS